MNRLLSFCLLVLFFCSSHAAVSVQTVTFNGPDAVVLEGVMYQPENWANGSGFSAVVMMHGCSGIWSSKNPEAVNGNGTPNLQNHIEKWGLKLAEEGVVALAVDSFTPRKPAEADAIEWQDQCSGSTYAGMVDSYTTRVLDARSAWSYLASNNKINASYIALMGWSHGAQASMVEAAATGKDADTARPAEDHLFASTLLFYPGCGSNLGFGGVNSSYWRPYRNVLMQMGDGDSFHDNCQTRFNRAGSVYGAIANSGYEALFVSHAEAAHSFDATSQTWPADYCVDNPPVGDTCAMNKADIESLLFLQAGLLGNRAAVLVDGDFDNDGDSDVLLRAGSTGAFTLASFQGGAVSGSAALSIPSGWTAADWVHQSNPDIDGDGDKDILMLNTTTGAWRKLLVEAGVYAGQSALWMDSGSVYTFIAAGDVDNDGDDDIVLKNTGLDTYQLNEIGSGSVADKRNLPIFGGDFSVQVMADFDADGDADVLMRRASTGKYCLFYMEAGSLGSSGGVFSLYSSSDWSFQAAADLDADGDADVLLRSISTGSWRVFIMQNGQVQSDAAIGLYTSLDWALQFAGDFDGDGDSDLLLRNSSGIWKLFPIQNGAVTGNTPVGLYSSTDWQIQP